MMDNSSDILFRLIIVRILNLIMHFTTMEYTVHLAERPSYSQGEAIKKHFS